MTRISQIDLLAAISKHLQECGYKTVSTHQCNALIRAADIIVEAMEREQSKEEESE
jgi:hypothetical protein